jgi:hypothetical protein
MPVEDHKKIVEGIFTDKENGVGIQFSGGVIVPFIATLAYIPISIIKNLAGFKDLIMPAEFFVVLVVLSLIACYFAIFRKDKYLKYFEIFELLSRIKKIRLTALIISISIVLFLIAFFTS